MGPSLHVPNLPKWKTVNLLWNGQYLMILMESGANVNILNAFNTKLAGNILTYPQAFKACVRF